uniref:Uncharacterized protein n=1 Tax=Panagrolaimus superbus TaxID=310955 RepID=A0A914Y4Y8_9BILA
MKSRNSIPTFSGKNRNPLKTQPKMVQKRKKAESAKHAKTNIGAGLYAGEDCPKPRIAKRFHENATRDADLAYK